MKAKPGARHKQQFLEMLFENFGQSYRSYMELRRQYESVRREVWIGGKLLVGMDAILHNHRRTLKEIMESKP